MTIEEAKELLKEMKESAMYLRLYRDKKAQLKVEAIDTVLKALEALEEYEKQLDLDYVRENYIPKEKVREKIEEYDNRRKELADGHFWENESNINEDTALVIAIETLRHLGE